MYEIYEVYSKVITILDEYNFASKTKRLREKPNCDAPNLKPASFFMYIRQLMPSRGFVLMEIYLFFMEPLNVL